ncbi:hypothetical protein DL93DRAFT_2052386 [Clavulina sp. PMI_390]|nr:hypothetical protein DL93DRAFT_2052386 [Clavulina sp. PMI_390]
MSTSNYTAAPPAYNSAPPKKYGAAEGEAASPLLNHGGASSSNAFFHQADSDIPDDFLYGTSAWESAAEIKNAFIQKVYSILFVQILGTCLVGGVVSRSPSTIFWVQTHVWAFYLPLFGTLVNLGFLYWKRHSHPLNLVLLSTFTLMESFTIGIAISFYDQTVVLQALLITLGVFLGLTLFTLQSKYDFSGMGPFLFAGLMVMVFSSLVSIFFPFSSTTELFYGIGGSLLFSGYVVYDTYIITKRLSPDEYIMGAISLYLDFINLFLSILRVLNGANRD